ncbi:MAG: ATP F0F1 synthase subunit B [Hyphomicrobiaceae bacterium]|nr:ATP F0F1 synthase subunit B [Hyphomicrobiaceae bacterium]
MAFDAAFWAFIALIVFIGVVIYLKVPGAITGALDKQIKKIEDDLSEAKRLREEAQAMLADYERKRKAAEAEAEEIVSAAREEADRMAREAEESLTELVARRRKAVEEKIAQAEAQAIADVRARSADVAIEAARHLLQDQMTKQGDDVISASIKEVGDRLN